MIPPIKFYFRKENVKVEYGKFVYFRKSRILLKTYFLHYTQHIKKDFGRNNQTV